jgi:MOSC domain-containing protein YiiM
MTYIHTVLIGQPQTVTDVHGTWTSAIFRTPVTGPVQVGMAGLAGDRVADTEHHGSPDQAICCHPIDHYPYWNGVYGLTELGTMLGPGSVGENWTISGATEADVCVGDIVRVGTARVQVTGPRIPCTKQERKLGLPEFTKRSTESLRTGFYVRVLQPGEMQVGDEWALIERPLPHVTVHEFNIRGLDRFDPDFARAMLERPEVGSGWKRIFAHRLAQKK